MPDELEEEAETMPREGVHALTAIKSLQGAIPNTWQANMTVVVANGDRVISWVMCRHLNITTSEELFVIDCYTLADVGDGSRGTKGNTRTNI